MRILLIYYEPRRSGQSRHVLSLAQGLDPARHRLTVMLPSHLGELLPHFEQAGAEVVPFPLRKLIADPRTWRALVRQIRASAPDIVHVHSQEAGLYARIAARLAGAPAVVYTPQTIDIRRARWHWLYALIERVLAASTDRIISVNDEDGARMRRWGIPARKIVTVPNGIDLREFEQIDDARRLRSSLGFARQDCLVMQVGRLSAQKSPTSFVEGAARVAERLPDARFVLVGDGPLRDSVVRRIEELGLGDKVRLAGWQADAQRLMLAADVVTLTSSWEGAPYSLLEAMAWSKPVVATRVNGCGEIVAHGESGLLVPPGDVAAWSDAVAELLRDRTKADAMGRAGRRRLEQRFTLGQMIGKVEAIYGEFCRGDSEPT